MQNQPIELDDLVVLLLGSPSRSKQLTGRIAGVTRLEKLVFLAERELPGLKDVVADSGDFHSYNFGPFSAKVYKSIDSLSAYGLVEDRWYSSPSAEDSWEAGAILGEERDPYSERRFTLTPRGQKYYNAVAAEVPNELIVRLGKFKDSYASLPLRQLVRYVYQNYEDFTDKSIIRDEILGG